MVIELPRADTVILWGPFPQLKEWRESLAVMRPGAQFTRAFKRKQWDGQDRPGQFKKVDGFWSLVLERGWLDRVRASFPDADVRVSADYRADPLALCLDLPETVSKGKYAYQARTLEIVQNRRWGRVSLATNAGKGAIMALAALNATPERVVILCNEVSVFHALQEELEEWTPDMPVGLVEAGRNDPPEERVVLAMVQTLHNRLYDSVKGKGGKITYVPSPGPWADWAYGVYVALCDEADLATADTYRRVLEAMMNTEYRVGFSGSFPEPDAAENAEDAAKALHDDRVLEGVLGPTLIRVKNKTLVKRKISAKPLVELVPYSPAVPRMPRGVCDACGVEVYDRGQEMCSDCPEGFVRKLTGPERRAWVYRHAVIENHLRHNLILSLLDPGEPNVVIVDKIAHGEALEDVIPDSVFLHGSVPKDVRKETLRKFQAGDFPVLIATRILQRGSNTLGNAVGVILASGEGSHRQVLQYIGRGLRRGGGKEFVYLRDVLDHGVQYLDKASKKRVRVYREEGFQLEMRR